MDCTMLWHVMSPCLAKLANTTWCVMFQYFVTTDYNECAIDNGGCDQICINTIMGQKCECDEGYSLDSDGSSCIANAQCIDGVCECLNGFVDENSSGSGSGSATTVNCVGKWLIMKISL